MQKLRWQGFFICMFLMMMEGSYMSEKKVVSRNTVVALGIVCIILAVGLVGAVANYTSIISEKENTIASLNSEITSLQNQINDLNATLLLINTAPQATILSH
jgi:predicted PurR-regulated permease PerM